MFLQPIDDTLTTDDTLITDWLLGPYLPQVILDFIIIFCRGWICLNISFIFAWKYEI